MRVPLGHISPMAGLAVARTSANGPGWADCYSLLLLLCVFSFFVLSAVRSRKAVKPGLAWAVPALPCPGLAQLAQRLPPLPLEDLCSSYSHFPNAAYQAQHSNAAALCHMDMDRVNVPKCVCICVRVCVRERGTVQGQRGRQV